MTEGLLLFYNYITLSYHFYPASDQTSIVGPSIFRKRRLTEGQNMSNSNANRSTPSSSLPVWNDNVPEDLFVERTTAASNARTAFESLSEYIRPKLVDAKPDASYLAHYDNTCAYYRHSLGQASTGVTPVLFPEAFKSMSRYLRTVTGMMKNKDRTQDYNNEERTLCAQTEKCNEELSDCDFRIWCASLGQEVTADELSNVPDKSYKIQRCWEQVLPVIGQYFTSATAVTDFDRNH
jgi:hypothetical protein